MLTFCLIINVFAACFMMFDSNKISIIEYFINYLMNILYIITVIGHIKDLGVMINNNFAFKEHMHKR